MEVVVAGSDNLFRFAVIDFTTPTKPGVVLVTPSFSDSCVVDAFATLVAVASKHAGEVNIFDISDPAKPILKGSVSTTLSGIGAISISNTSVVVGELDGIGIAFIDVSDATNPTVRSNFDTSISSIASIAISGSKAVCSGANDMAFLVIDYSDPSNPTEVRFQPPSQGVTLNFGVVVDLDGTRMAVADNTAQTVWFFDVSGAAPSLLGKQTTVQQGIFSISINGTIVCAASANDANVSLISFQNTGSPSEADFNPGLTGGYTVKLTSDLLAAGDTNGTQIALFKVSGTSTSLLGNVDAQLPSIETIAVVDFSKTSPPTPPTIEITEAKASTALLIERNGKWAPQPNGINISWQSTKTITGIDIEMFSGAITRNVTDTGPSFPAGSGKNFISVPIAGLVYNVKVRGHIASASTPYSQTIKVDDPENLHSLRAFLVTSGIDPTKGIRKLLSILPISFRNAMGI
jgi:hypothetical protein